MASTFRKTSRRRRRRHHELTAKARAALRGRPPRGRVRGRIIMVSPFVSFITYSVLDGCRLIVAPERRHVERARRVTDEPDCPCRPNEHPRPVDYADAALSPVPTAL